MKNHQETEVLNNCKSCNMKLIYTTIKIIIVSAIISAIVIIIIFSSEAISQKAFSSVNSAGNCRMVNTKYAFDNNLNFEMHYFIQIDKENSNKFVKGIHLYAVDQDKKIYDVSNNSETIGSSYEEYIKKRNIIFDELLVSGQFNKENYNTKIHEYFNITGLSSLIALPIYYCTYKFYE